MEEQEQKKALIKVEPHSLAEVGKKLLPKVADAGKRIGKIVGWASLSTMGLGAFALGSVPVATVGLIASAGTAARAIQNTLYKTEPSLMFMSRNKGGEKQIFQDVRLNLASKMQGYNSVEKAGMMGLQTLVGFNRYKENLKYADYELGEKGEKIYCQKISTVTHSVNLKTLQMLDELGYIKIDSMEEKFKQNVADKILGKEPQGKRMLLIREKLGFRNYTDLRKIGKAFLTGDKDTLESMKKTFQKITFRLTDKKINFEELYKKSANLSEITDKKERLALKRLAVIFDNKQGILTTKGIDIAQDSFGRDYIRYNRRESLGKRVQREMQIEDRSNEKFNFQKELREKAKEKPIQRETGREVLLDRQKDSGREF